MRTKVWYKFAKIFKVQAKKASRPIFVTLLPNIDRIKHDIFYRFSLTGIFSKFKLEKSALLQTESFMFESDHLRVQMTFVRFFNQVDTGLYTEQ